MSQNTLPIIHALWVGERLGSIAKCCLQSFILRGHKVYLHAYQKINDLPNGVCLIDANKIIPNDKLFKHKKTGSYALFSDIFRYELLSKVDGVYVDCDVYCLKPICLSSSEYLLGFEDDNSINGAVLALPPKSKLLRKLLEISNNPAFIPPWYEKTKQRFKIKNLWKKKPLKHVSDMPWGVLGPQAITYFVKQMGLTDLISPIDIYYPVHYSCISQILDPDLRITDLITSRTICFHLYNEMIKLINLNDLNESCVLSKMLRNEI